MQAVGSSSNSVALNDGVSSSIKATVFDYATSNPIATTLVDTNGDPASIGGGTQYTEDAAAAANPVGTAVSLVRQDTPAALVSADGDNVAQRGTNYGAAYTQIVSSTGAFVDTFGGGTQYTQGDTDASITGTAMLMEGAADTLLPVQGTVADGLLVNLGTNNDVTVTSGAITETNSAAIAASLSVLDDWDETNRAAVNIIAGQVGVAGGTGTDGATVQRVTLATDVGLPAGTSNIGDVDIASVIGVVNAANSSTATLLSGATFTGTGVDVLGYASICVSVKSDVASAASGLSLQFSSDNSNWDIAYGHTLPAGSGRTFKLGVEARYFRIVYTNGGTGQAYFRLQTILTPTATKHFGMPVGEVIVDGDNAQLTKSVITGVTTAGGGAYVDVKVSPSGAVQVGGTLDAITSLPLPTGAATSANQTTIIGHVDGIEALLTTIDSDTSTLSVTGSGTAAGALRVELPTNGTGVIATVGAVTAITNALPTGTNAIGRVGHDITGIGHGVTTVTTAGTDVALAASTPCKSVVITAQTDNTNIIAVGATGVDATVATGTGVPLSPGDSICIDIDNLADIFIDSLVNGEGVRYTYFT